VDVITDPKSPVYGMTVIDHRARRVAREPTHDIAIAVDREQFMLRFRRALAPPPEWHEERRRKREAADGA
jgi:inosine-uridine nucleoside N-ribohydrolase